jgi:hypothetical protein
VGRDGLQPAEDRKLKTKCTNETVASAISHTLEREGREKRHRLTSGPLAMVATLLPLRPAEAEFVSPGSRGGD